MAPDSLFLLLESLPNAHQNRTQPILFLLLGALCALAGTPMIVVPGVMGFNLSAAGAQKHLCQIGALRT